MKLLDPGLLRSVAVRIKIVAFATAADILGGRESSLEAPSGTTVDRLLDLLEESAPELASVRDRLAVAVDGRLARSSDILTDDSEIALLPPVSGGRPDTSRLTRRALDIAAITSESANPACGAQLLFLGRVRSSAGGPAVTHLTYEAYEPMAERALAAICRELSDPAADTRLEIVHRLGEVPLGEPSVAIVAVSPHREEAYRLSRTALERLKREVPLWKREHFADGSASWREEERIQEGTATLSGRKP